MLFLQQLTNKHTVLMLFLGLVSSSSYGQNYFGTNDNNVIGDVDNKKVAALQGKYHLKCWQQGELLFEETGLDLNVNRIGTDLNSVSFVKGKDDKTGIYLLTLGSSTCLYKKM